MPVTWNLSKHFYSSETDKKIQRDIKKTTKVVDDFVQDFYGKTITDSRQIEKMLSAYEQVYEVVMQARPLVYFLLRQYQNSQDTVANQAVAQYMNIYTELENKLVFVPLALQKIPPKQQQHLLQDPSLERHRYYLQKVFALAPYTLSEQAEQVMNAKTLSSYTLWVKQQEQRLNAQTVTYQKKQIPLTQAASLLTSVGRGQRRRLQQGINKGLATLADLATGELNAIVLDKSVTDSLRGHQTPYSARLLADEVEPQSIQALLKAVTESYDIAHEFYVLKAQLLHCDRLQYEDRQAVYGSINNKYTFQKSVNTFTKLLESYDKKLVTIFKKYHTNSQIDVTPRPHKRGGAFHMSTINNPGFVLLNHADNINSYFTLAHEMGHAFHSELSRIQPPLYQSYSTAVAEVASTFFEGLAFYDRIRHASTKEKIVLLHDRLNGKISSIFRQTAFFNMELAMHTTIRAQGGMTTQQLQQLCIKHLQAYLGSAVEVRDDDGYEFVRIPHIRTFFYVYSYVYGELLSQLLIDRVQNDATFFKSVLTLLAKGSSQSPYDMFLELGIDTADVSLWDEAIGQIRQDMEMLKELTKEHS